MQQVQHSCCFRATMDYLSNQIDFCLYYKHKFNSLPHSQSAPKVKISSGLACAEEMISPCWVRRSSDGSEFIRPRRPLVSLVNSSGSMMVTAMAPSCTRTSTPAPEWKITVTFWGLGVNTNTPRNKRFCLKFYDKMKNRENIKSMYKTKLYEVKFFKG